MSLRIPACVLVLMTATLSSTAQQSLSGPLPVANLVRTTVFDRSGQAPSPRQTATPSSGAPASSAEAEVRRLSALEVEAFLRNDPKTLASLWSADFVVTNPLNQFVTKAQVLKMIESGILVITSFDRQLEYAKVYDDTVIVAGRETVVWGGKMPNAGRTERLRITAVWMRQQGQWQQVARHANIVP